MSRNEAFDRHVRFGERQLEREVAFIVAEVRRLNARDKTKSHQSSSPSVTLNDHPLSKLSVDERNRNRRVEEITRDNMLKKGCQPQRSFANLVAHGGEPITIHRSRPLSTSRTRRVAVGALLEHGSETASKEGRQGLNEARRGSYNSLHSRAATLIQRWWRCRSAFRDQVHAHRLHQAAIVLDEAARVIVQFMRRSQRSKRRIQ